jgi:hypothetical protein
MTGNNLWHNQADLNNAKTVFGKLTTLAKLNESINGLPMCSSNYLQSTMKYVHIDRFLII